MVSESFVRHICLRRDEGSLLRTKWRMPFAILETTGPRCPRVCNELERICDRLASELLMPRHFFLNAVGSSLSIEKIFELARVVDTSLSATAIRCAELLGVSAFGTEGKVVSWGIWCHQEGSEVRNGRGINERGRPRQRWRSRPGSCLSAVTS